VLPAVWQLHDRYIFAQIKGGLLIVDQHAAHERVLYEQALRRLGAEKATSQELLFPQVVDLTREEFDTLLEIQPALERLGFHLSSFGGTTVVVHGVPLGLRNWRDGALLRELIDLAATYPEGQSVEERVAKSYACHAAVRSGEPLTPEEMNGLIDLLFGTSRPQGDPHGRPAFLRLPLEELDRRFGRS
jgi:DNA mismatch repair protein MutL